MSKIMQDFKADQFLAQETKTVEVISFNKGMAVCLEDGIIMITKQQAMDFFGLKEIDYAAT